MLHTETVEQRTLELIKQLSADPILKDFHLVGGTALALQFGHRKSVDIDMFSDKPFDAKAIMAYLAKKYQAENLRSLSNGIWSDINEVKVDMMSHQYPWLKPPQTIDGVRMVSSEDIAAMKINVIYGKGTRRKDFADMYFLLEKFSLNRILDFYQQKYPDTNRGMAKYALLYTKKIKSDVVEYIGESLTTRQLNARIKAAVFNPDKVFEPVLQKISLKQSKGQKQ